MGFAVQAYGLDFRAQGAEFMGSRFGGIGSGLRG